MNAVIPGYRYELANLNHPGTQVLQFIQAAPVPVLGADTGVDFQLVTTTEGTTTEEVLKALIDRLKFQNNLVPARENSLAITKLEEGLMWLDKRQADRKARGVQGTNQQ